MLPGTDGANVRKTARYAGKDCDPLHQILYKRSLGHKSNYPKTQISKSERGKEGGRCNVSDIGLPICPTSLPYAECGEDAVQDIIRRRRARDRINWPKRSVQIQ